MQKKRLNIGFLADDLDMSLTAEVIQGASIAAKELDANLFLFPGKYLKPDYRDKKMAMYNYQFNTIFSYAGINHLDILYVMLGSIASTRTKQEQIEFLNSLGDIPIIILCCEIDGYPSITFDNTSGLYQEIAHLITEHHCQKIGFVGGPETNDDAIEREETFRKVLADYQIPLSENQIVHGNFSDYCYPVIEKLLAQNDKLDAIVFANDSMAVAGYQILKEHGYQIGKDILVAGFDDTSFAVSMNPPLTTVRADGTDLGYKALILGADYHKNGTFENYHVPSSMILRKSCGCSEPNGHNLAKRLGICNTDCPDFISKKKIILNYLFSGYIAISDKANIMDAFAEFMNMLFLPDALHQNLRDRQDLIYNHYINLFSLKLLTYTTSDRLFDALRYLHYLLETDPDCQYDHIALSDLFYHLYRATTEQTIAANAKNKDELDQLNHRINSFTRETLTFDDTIDISYETIAETLKSMNMTNGYVYVFEEPISHIDDDIWEVPDYVYLKAYHNTQGSFSVDVANQKLPITSLLINDYTKEEHRVTRILAPLFSNEKQYGLLLCELEQKYHSFLIPSISQLSAAIRTLFLLERQKRVESELKVNLQIAKQNNEYLESISKIDELSAVYNRRGFYDQLQQLFQQPDLQGQKAVLLFGDLDGLKIINDQYGHDDGDIAIRTIAEVLTEAFAADGIVARFGGDEFVSLILTTQMEFEQTLLPSFIHIKNAANERLHLPYVIDMSIGYTEFSIRKDVNLSELLEVADNKLYLEKKAKKTIRNH